ncbi:MAG: 30S ribosomal protein S12 methylthiotransferase RimO [Desulfamplus sp.]|nr:30S ribosomal protein S12 methylthiotransferase RimO [Desulfamplus sp.]MBF0412638.1 30S ribosomal protein S12 methylthiotransferase RimO [Desulfamplus sp.]
MKIYLESLGCCRNQIDSEVMLGRLAHAHHEICHEPSEAEVIIVNTCGFISSASAEAIDTILELAEYKKAGSCKRLVVTGCLPERFRDDTLSESLPEVDAFLGTGACDDIVRAVECGTGCKGAANLTPNKKNTEGEGRAGKLVLLPDPCARQFQGYPLPRILTLNYSAYIKISEGCNRKCTYCIIPKLRGKQRSRSIENITAEASHLIKNGIREIILVGENTTDYGIDIFEPTTASTKNGCVSANLANLLEQISICADKTDSDLQRHVDKKEGQVPIWLRLLYTHPSSITKEVIERIASLDNFCTYFDVPIQHASSKILKRMGRNYDLAHLYRLFELIRKISPDATLRTTLITGFPGETDSDFKTMLKFVEDIQFDHLGVFAYSDSEDLPSHHLKKHVPENVAEERLDIIMAAQSRISEKINKKYMGQILNVLVEENPDEGIYIGRTRFQAPEVDGITFIYGSGLEIGGFADVKITETHEYDLAGEHSSYDPAIESRAAKKI